MNYRKYPDSLLKHLIAAPFIYMMIVPLVLLDISMEIYHRICFPLYGIDYVNRKEYIKIDRHRLSYLTGLEKINCAYCGYANGLMHYASIIAGETERYWCSIKHEEDSNFLPPQHHNDFLEHGNKDGLIELTADEYLQD